MVFYYRSLTKRKDEVERVGVSDGAMKGEAVDGGNRLCELDATIVPDDLVGLREGQKGEAGCCQR